jgi:hypothetical protein
MEQNHKKTSKVGHSNFHVNLDWSIHRIGFAKPASSKATEVGNQSRFVAVHYIVFRLSHPLFQAVSSTFLYTPHHTLTQC